VRRSLDEPIRGLVLDKVGTRARLWHELVVVARFGMVGITATAVHILMVWLLLSKTALPPLIANMFAFLTAFGISFAGNYLWTFGSPGNPGKAMRRFVLISASAFAVNTLLLASLLRGGWLSPTVAAIVSAAVVPTITFLASRLWGFKGHKEASS
jgi:putative flippase GtrA